MNHWYRVIWSHVKHCYIVVSELAKRDGKSSRHVGKGQLTALVLAALVSLGSGVYAAEPPAATPLTGDQQVVYNAVLQELAKNGVHYISVKGESQDNDSNYKNDGAKGNGAVAIGEKALAAKGGTVSIGRNAHIEGKGGNTDGEGSVAIGDNTLITTNGLDLASIAIGKNAKVLNGSGKQERGLSFTPDNFDKPGFYGRGNTLPKHPDKVPGGIAIGTNSYARTASIQIGAHTFLGYQMGGVDITQSTNDSESNIVGMTTIGTNTYNKGAFANMYGAYSVITGGYTGAGGFNSLSYGAQNFGANVVGSLNSIRSKGHSGSSGIANSIVGVANTVENANGTLVYGAGNKVTNSITSISAPSGLTTLNTWEDTVTGLQKAIKDSNSGGAVLAIGGGNVADYVRHSQLVGVNNTVTGTENKVSEFNMVDGYKNTVTNGKHVTMIGSENTATDSESTVIMGDKQKVTKVKHGVLLGSQDTETETTVADVVAIGHNAHVQKAGGIALGSGAIAKRDKGAFGYDAATGKVLDEAGAAAALGNSAALKPLAETYTAAKAAYEAAKQAVDAKQQEVTAIEKECGKFCTGEKADRKLALKHELNKLKTTLTEKKKAYEESQTAINNSLYPWKSTAAAVSVGDAEKHITRQITGVAAGTEDTDAVNVAQLKRVLHAVDNNRVHYMAVNGTAQDAVSNYNNDGAKQAGGIAIGESAKSDAVGGIAIGRGVEIWYSGGVPTQASGDIAIGDQAHINNYINQGGSVTIGSHAFSENMTGGEEWDVNFSQTEYVPNDTWLGVHEPKDPSKVIGSMAIGQNAYSRTGSTMVGMHNYTGKVGDLEVTNDIKMANLNVYSTTVGSNSYNNGAFATVYGAYSTISSNYDGDKRNNLAQSLGATITGSLNSIEAKTGSDYAGIGNSITGMANRTVNANGALIYGAGNMIQNSWDTIHVGSENSTSAEDFQAKLVAQRKNTTSGDSAKGMQEVLMDSVKKSANGGAVIAIGGGNTANYVRHSQLVGVNNTVTGTETTVSEFNTIDGYQNTVTNGKHVTLIGSENTATDSESTLIMGDKQKVTKVKHGVLLGSQDAEKETTVADVVAIGHNAHVEKEGGIALGSYSIASVDKGIIGYDPITGKASTETSAIWKATQAALSVGSTEDKNNLITRQITGVAAGTEDTDAVNVAQLKKVAAKIKDVADNAGSKVDIKGGDTGITVTPKKDDKTGVTTYTVGLGNTIKAGNVTINGEASADNGKDGKSTITGLSNTTWDGTNIVSGRAATEDQLKAAVEKVVSGSAKQTTVTKGTNIVVTEGANTAGGKDYTVALDKNLTGLESATFTKTVKKGDKEETTSTVINDLGTTVTDKDGNKTVTTAAGITITAGENTVSLKNDGLHNGDHKILGVADGRIAAQSREAVNGGQVYRMMREAAAATDGKVGAAAAGSAALAALHPLNFDPDAKWNVAASYGTYGPYQAYALGAYYRPSESAMVSVGGTIGSGADAMNVGLSFKVGKGNLNHISTSRVAMAKEIQDLRAEVEALRQAVISLHEGHDVSPLASALFLDTPENHAAYQSVQALAAKGVLPAYAQGNKVKTRYEIATMLYAAVQQGKAIDGTLLRTFAPELERVHVAVISRKDNGEAAITRVRVGKL